MNAEDLANAMIKGMSNASITTALPGPKERARLLMEAFTIAMAKVALIEPEFAKLMKQRGLN